MSCRETPAGSAFTSLARLGVEHNVTDQVCLSEFHRLRRVHQVDPGTVPEWRARQYLAQYEYDCLNALNRLPRQGLSERREASLRERLERARHNPPRLRDGQFDYATMAAVHRIQTTVYSASNTYDRNVAYFARELGESPEELRGRMQEWERSAPPRREAMDGFSQGVVAESGRMAGGGEYRRRYAYARVVEEARQVWLAKARHMPQALPEQLPPVGGREGVTGVGGVAVVAAGYNKFSGRAEFVTSDGARRAYRNVTSEMWEEHRDSPGRLWGQVLRGSPDHAYEDKFEEQMSAVARRCPTCGQYASAGHECPPPVAVTESFTPYWGSRYTPQQVEAPGVDGVPAQYSLRLPAIRRMQSAARQGGATIDIGHQYFTESHNTGRGSILLESQCQGTITATPGGEEGFTVDSSRLRCTCEEYQRLSTCRHVDICAAAVRERLGRGGGGGGRTAEQRQAATAAAQRRAEAAAALDWTRQHESLADAAKGWRGGSDVTYSEDTDVFLADYREILGQVEQAGKDGDGPGPVPVVPSDGEGGAMGGLCRPGSGQAFGMEIEFDFPPTMDYSEKARAAKAIARDLYEAGLTNADRQQWYGASRRLGFRDYNVDGDGVGTWSFENDCSVDGGEIVTSGLYDTEDTWRRVGTALDIVKRHGGVASKKAGLHVHVGTGNYGGQVGAYRELYRSVKQHEDVLYRVAANPGRGTHRRGIFAKPLPSMGPGSSYTSVSSVRAAQYGRYRALNLAHVSGDSGDHPEFRVFDSSLDLGTVQVQAKVAAGLVEAARRRATGAAGESSRGDEPVGSHKDRGFGRRKRRSDAEILEETATARSLADTLFQRREDKKQFFALFARNKWQAAFRG